MDKLNATAVFINDQQLISDLMQQALADQGMRILGTFTEIEPGLAFIRQEKPALVFLDMMMPFVRPSPGLLQESQHPYMLYDCQPSFEAARTIREKFQGTKIIMVTGERHPHTFVTGFRSGADGIASKVDGWEDFLQIVVKVLQGQRGVTSPRMEALIDDYLASPAPQLTPLEVRILELVQEGLESREIGGQLNYAPKTIRNALSAINHKLRTRNRFEAAEVAIEMGLVGWRTGYEGEPEP